MGNVFIHGMNMGDTLFASQALYENPDSVWVTDEYNRDLITWLCNNTDCPIRDPVFLESPGSKARRDKKFVPFCYWGEDEWIDYLESIDIYPDSLIIPNVRMAKSRGMHMIHQLINRTLPYPVSFNKKSLNPSKLIVLACESWCKSRHYRFWDSIDFPDDYEVVELITSDNYGGHFQTRFDKILVDSFDDSYDLLREASLLVGISSFTSVFSSVMGVPTIMMSPQDRVCRYSGVWPWKGVDLHLKTSPESLSLITAGHLI